MNKENTFAQEEHLGYPLLGSQWFRRTSTNGLALLRAWVVARGRWGAPLELSLIVAWAAWVGRDFLNLDPMVWPAGGEFPMVIQSHFIWKLFQECGACFFWNGLINGGYPAFAELQGAPLNPVVILATLTWGVVNGAKITLVLSLAVAGAAQWWLARVMKLGLIPRLWVAAIAVTGGHLAGKMENGGLTLILSTAMASLVLAPAIQLALTGRRRSAIWLAMTLALAATAGQGYLQIGLALGVLPALGIFLLDERLKPEPLWKEYLIAVILALLIAAVFLVPLGSFMPNFAKDLDDTFNAAQPLQYTPLNLVIENKAVFESTTLTNQPWPYLYLSYIGWVPVILAVLGVALGARSHWRLKWFFILALILVYLASRAKTFGLLAEMFPGVAASFRNTPLIAGLAVPLVLGLAAWGLDLLIARDWPTINWNLGTGEQAAVQTTWLVLLLPLLIALSSTYRFSRSWLVTTNPPQELVPIVEMIPKEPTRWVAPPFGEHFWSPVVLGAGFKATGILVPWRWEGRETPPPAVEAFRFYRGLPRDGEIGKKAGVTVFATPENYYASVRTASGIVPCHTEARGGNIDVECHTQTEGTLTVTENRWTGWSVTRNGASQRLLGGQWLQVNAPAGQHLYQFRYRPWDVTLGGILTILGLGLAVHWWRQDGHVLSGSS